MESDLAGRSLGETRERERFWLEHVRAARSQGLSLSRVKDPFDLWGLGVPRCGSWRATGTSTGSV